MGHILILVGKVFLVVLLSAAVIVGVSQLSSTFTAHALYVKTEVKVDPPGIAKIIYGTGESPSEVFNPDDNFPTDPDTDTDSEGTLTGDTQQGEPTPPGGNASSPSTSSSDNKTKNYIPPGQTTKGGGGGGGAAKPKVVNPKSNRPTILTINTNIEFGTVFPGEELEGEFTISLTDPQNPIYVEYHIEFGVKSGYEDLYPYLTVERDSTETDTESDTVISASLGLGTPADVSDHWLVTIDPVLGDPPIGDYWTVITIHVTNLGEEEPEPPPTQEP